MIVFVLVFQDGTIENVFSTDLYPIHHLDEQEFFPGDFVTHSGTPTPCHTLLCIL